MTRTLTPVILFIGTEDHASDAAARFHAVARTFGLPWMAESRAVTPADQGTLNSADLVRAGMVIGIGKNQLSGIISDRYPDVAPLVEYWEPEVVEREVMNLVARLLGGKRSAVTSPPTVPERQPTRKTHTVRVGRETAGRRGKGVTTIWDLPLNESEIRELAATLKQRCGTGGTVKDGKIEIQGDHRDRVAAELENLGYKVKRSGG